MTDRLHRWLPILLLIAAPCALYAQSLGNGFVIWDDNSLVYKNPIIQNFSLYSLRAIFTRYDPELYIPLTFFTYQIEHLLFGFNASAYHFTNLALHCGNAIMVYLLLKRWRIDAKAAWIAAAMFAIHPMNSEAVLWVSARKDTLSSFFFLTTLLEWERFRETHTRGRYWKAVILFALGLMSKVSIALLPIVLLLTDWRDSRTFDRRCWKEKLPFFLLSGLFIVIALFGKSRNIASVGIWHTVLLAAKATAFSMGTFVWPFSLSSIYHQSSPIGLLEPDFLWSAIAVVLMLACIMWSMRRTRTVAYNAIFFALLIGPSFANFAKPGGIYFASDRYIYLAQIGILALLCQGWMSAQRTQWSAVIARSVLCILLVLTPTYVWASYQRSVLWGNSEALFRDAMIKNPDSPTIRFNLAVVRQEQGDIDDALNLYLETIRRYPKYSAANNNAGVIFQDRGDRAKAEHYYRTAIEGDPHNANALTNLGALLSENGKVDEAMSLLLRATEDDPYNPYAWSNLGTVYGKKGMYTEGLRAFQNAWKLDPEMTKESKQLEMILQSINEKERM